MSCYISQYVKACDLCLRTKAQCCPLIGESVPLPILEFYWDIISIDFIVEFLESHGYDVVMNFVDSVSKISHFIPMHTTLMAVRGRPVFHSKNISESFQLQLPPSSGDTSEHFLFRAPSSSPQCYCMLLPL